MTEEGGAVVASAFGGGGGGGSGSGGLIFTDRNNFRRPNFDTLLHTESIRISTHQDEKNYSSRRTSNASAGSSWRYDCSPSSSTGDAYPSSEFMSPWNQASPWTRGSSPMLFDDGKSFPEFPEHGMIGSLVREEGHMYSLAASGDLLYTGSESKNIRVWKNLKEYSGFKSNSGLVKAIVITGDRIFTGHQDGKIRVWKFSPKNDRKPTYKRVGSLPTGKDFIKCSLNRKSYVEVRRRRNVPWIKHYDAVSSMSLDENQGLLYSASWDKTFKVWRISDSKCLESVNAHDDALNSVAFAGFDGLVLTGSADGTVKLWKREFLGKTSKHVLAQTLLKQENAVTSLAVNAAAAVIYCGSSDGVLNFWQQEKQLSHGGLLRGHKLAVLCLATAGNLVFSGSADKSICVWRRSDGGDHTCLSIFTGHCGPVKCLAVEEDQNSSKADPRWIVYSGSLDKSVKVWRVCENPNLKQFQIS